MNIKDIKKHFPIFEQKINGKALVYLDSANFSKTKKVIDPNKFYSEDFANVGRGIYTLAANASEQYENTRLALKNL